MSFRTRWTCEDLFLRLRLLVDDTSADVPLGALGRGRQAALTPGEAEWSLRSIGRGEVREEAPEHEVSSLQLY